MATKLSDSEIWYRIIADARKRGDNFELRRIANEIKSALQNGTTKCDYVTVSQMYLEIIMSFRL